MDNKDYIGKILEVKVDREFGSKHPKHGFIYPVNYGYIPNTVSGDGEELDCYILGVFEPIREFKGKCIAIIHRINDDDDKLVVVPENVEYSDEAINALVEFQERFFDSRYESLYPKSCGAIVYRRARKGVEYLCLKQTSGVYSTPKGHMEAHETEAETARREIFEEIGLHLELDTSFRFVTDYNLRGGKVKTLVLFISECVGKPKIDTGEITEHSWLSYTEAREILPHWYTEALEKVNDMLK